MLALDHIVIAASDPEKAAKDFGKKNDITIAKGGRHVHWGTYNHLAYFRNHCYIEWIGIFDETIAAKSDNPLIQLLVRKLKENMEGPIQYALRTDKMDSYVNKLQSLEVPFTGPIPGSRKRPDGRLLEWRMLFPEGEGEVLPFLIEWGEVKNTPQDTSLINDREINSLTAAINDPATFTSIYQLSFSHNQTTQLENTRLTIADQLDFLIS
ncbi:VOC family protein [Lentibacillus lipolyticus]|nr:VOC family protein [Lentibacillus lipolyticus]